MTQAQPVISEVFVSGMTYEQFLAAAKSNKAGFEQNYSEFTLADADRKFFADLNAKVGPMKVLAIVEDWCPDVVRGLPVMARIAEATGMELRLFRRDANPALMGMYLKEGKYMSIPVFAFFDKGFRPMGHWIERPGVASQHIEQVRQERERGDGSPEEKRAEMAKRMAAQRSLWRQETVREIREMLSRHGGQ